MIILHIKIIMSSNLRREYLTVVFNKLGSDFMNTNLEYFAKKIKVLRLKRGFTQEKLSEMIGISTNHLSKLEIAGSNPSFDTIEKLALALNIEIKELFNFDEFKNVSYVKDEFQKILKYSSDEHIRLLYKIHNNIIN